MNQEVKEEKLSSDESIADLPEDSLNPAEAINDSTEKDGSRETDNLPIESIGSYARLEELPTDEEKEKTSNPTVES